MPEQPAQPQREQTNQVLTDAEQGLIKDSFKFIQEKSYLQMVAKAFKKEKLDTKLVERAITELDKMIAHKRTRLAEHTKEYPAQGIKLGRNSTHEHRDHEHSAVKQDGSLTTESGKGGGDD